MQYPSKTGTTHDVPDDISKTIPEVLPLEYRAKIDYKEMHNFGTLNYSKKTSQIFSRFLKGFKATKIFLNNLLLLNKVILQEIFSICYKINNSKYFTFFNNLKLLLFKLDIIS